MDTTDNTFGQTLLGDDEFAKLSMGFRRSVKAILKENDLGQDYLAERLGKHQSEISRWLSGMHNLTLRNMAKINAALPEPAIRFTRSIQAAPTEEDRVGLLPSSERTANLKDYVREIEMIQGPTTSFKPWNWSGEYAKEISTEPSMYVVPKEAA